MSHGVSDGEVELAAVPLMFDRHVRRRALLYCAAIALPLIALSALFPADRSGYLLAWVLAAGPFTTPALWFTWLAIKRSPAAHRQFWRAWLVALSVLYLAGTALVGAVVLGVDALFVASAALGLASLPVWFVATVSLLRTVSGLRGITVDLVDVLITVVAISAPGVFFLIEGLLDAQDPLFAGVFGVVLGVSPALVYVTVMNFTRVPRGRRLTQGIGLALALVSVLNLGLQVAQVLRDFSIPAPPLIAVEVLNMGLLMILPLFSHGTEPGGLDLLPPEGQLRRVEPLPYLPVIVIPALAVVAFSREDEQAWGPGFIVGALLLVAALAAVRTTLAQREARRLTSQLEQVATRRRELLAQLVRALEDDRHRVASELHEQAVESFATLGHLVQTAYGTLPPDTAIAVRDALGTVQADLSDRVESLRRLMVAIQPPTLERGGLETAITAYADDLFGAPSTLALEVRVAPGLDLDWSTKTIVYRVAQEALHNVHAHAEARRASVTVAEHDGAVVVRVVDDGVGFEPGGIEESGIATMRLFAGLGRGRLDIVSSSAGGVEVRATLGVIEEDELGGPSGPPTLRLLVNGEESQEPAR